MSKNVGIAGWWSHSGPIRDAQGRGWQLAMGNSIGNDLDRKTFRLADRFVPSLAVTHHAWKLEGFGDPTAIVFAIQVNRHVHAFIILRVLTPHPARRDVGVEQRQQPHHAGEEHAMLQREAEQAGLLRARHLRGRDGDGDARQADHFPHHAAR